MKNYLIGDFHMEKPNIFYTLDYYLNGGEDKGFYADIKDLIPLSDVCFIVLGDFGGNITYGTKYQKWCDEFKEEICAYGCTYFVIRGNHDQRVTSLFRSENWHYEQYFGNAVIVENKYPLIKYALDRPAVYEIDGYKTLVLPGAESIDKQRRLMEEEFTGVKTWFADEEMSDCEQEYARTLCRLNDWKFDLVLSHTCPAGFMPRYSLNDVGWVTKKTEKFLNEIEYNLTYISWAWGHHHDTVIYEKEDGHYNALLYTYPISVKNLINGEGDVKRLAIKHKFW